MARCDVLLQTSRNEGTPVALIQGMAAARPFVSTAVGGVVDMVTALAGGNRAARIGTANGVLADAGAGTLAGALPHWRRTAPGVAHGTRGAHAGIAAVSQGNGWWKIWTLYTASYFEKRKTEEKSL